MLLDPEVVDDLLMRQLMITIFNQIQRGPELASGLRNQFNKTVRRQWSRNIPYFDKQEFDPTLILYEVTELVSNKTPAKWDMSIT
ncbi:hypothetical protein M758_1G246700 [Ceratodon purpureus]|uniref:Uncharacterized protein n=1 Tax=Ceratodon purpureus TaxID=3225 RepID=A0A8T0JAB7_CERPU|nr:hypothetical protein KC19_1G253000 [Ceratodon purpureus]KAG0631353.1 hypothetical protein M758_1G246700 [Ceratodon purpureus]